jgi:hypothetical protein
LQQVFFLKGVKRSSFGFSGDLPRIEQPTAKTEIETDENCEAIVTGWANRPALHLPSAAAALGTPSWRFAAGRFTNDSSLLGHNHFRDPANAGVACIQVVLFVHDEVTGFDELAGAYTRSVTDRTKHLAISV